MAPISHKAMRELGWVRVDPKPWSKLHAQWLHTSGWTMRHCGHPTAHFPWMLLPPEGVTMVAGVPILPGVGVLSGVIYGGTAQTGYAWGDLRSPAEWLAGFLGLEAA